MTTSDEGALCAVGNGRVLGYLRGADVHTLFGPHYSSPDLGTVTWETFTRPVGELPGSANYRARSEGVAIEAFAEAEQPALTLRWDLDDATRLMVHAGMERATRWSRVEVPDVSGWVAEIPRGSVVFRYPASKPHYLLVIGDGLEEAEIGAAIEGGDGVDLVLRARAGLGWLSLVTSDDFADALDVARALSESSVERRSEAGLTARLARIREFVAPQIVGVPDDLWRLAADQIMAQQSIDGGLIAGHNYALCYLRDQYGTCEGLAALGLHDAVAANIRFRFAVWERFGDLANAESMSPDPIRHHHENDRVEQTGYMVLQVTRHVAATGDVALLREVAPMLAWCLEQQRDELVGGALPFNGDETYVAGGVLPRWALTDGSLEATLLYLAAIDDLSVHRDILPFTPGFWYAQSEAAAQIRRGWERNFVRADRGLVTNSLVRRRLLGDAAPASRPGVCENCSNFPTTTVRQPSGRYVCHLCTTVPMGAQPEQELSITSATLFPAFVPNDLVPLGDLAAVASASLARWDERGYLPSSDDGDTSVGYDEGLLLRALTATGLSDEAAGVAAGLADRADQFGTWAEYYESGAVPSGTRCRPWETGMNIAALAEFARAREESEL